MGHLQWLPKRDDSAMDGLVDANVGAVAPTTLNQGLPEKQTAAADQRKRFAATYRVLGGAIATRAFPGCAFGMIVGDEIVLSDALGTFTYDEGSPKVRSDTVFDVASMTKVVATTSAAMLLHQRGQIDLDTPVGELLPGFVVGRDSSEHARKVTLRHLLAHSSGLPGYRAFYKSLNTPTALFRACLEMSLEAEPGARVEYSDLGFILLGKALEVITREYLAIWVRREVFQPLGLSATGFCPQASVRSQIPPTEQDNSFRMRRIQGEVQDEHAYILKGAGGHAGLFSNVPDLLRFSREFLSRSDSALFSRETIEFFAERQPPSGSTRALGWDTPSPEQSSAGSHFSNHSIGHLGYSGCSLWIDLDAGVAAVLLTNRTWPDRQNQMIREVRSEFHDSLREAIS